LKILYFHQHFSTPKGSTGTRSYEFSKELIKRGHSVTLVCGKYWIADCGLNKKFKNGKRSGMVDGIKVIQFDLNYSNSLSFLNRTIVFLKFSLKSILLSLSLNYDVIFATSTPLTIGIPGIFSKVIRKKIFIFEVRDLWPELPRAMGVITNPFILKAMDILETMIYKCSNSCIGLSPGIIKGIIKKTPEKTIEMIPNGCDNNFVKHLKINIKKNTRKNKFVAVFTGAHGYANGLNAVLSAAKLLKEKKEKSIEFQFIGDGVLKPELIDRVKHESINNCVFLDPMPKVELFKYLLKEADLGLMILEDIPAFYDGTSPNKFFDYISLGLPVLNNYPGWLSKLIKEENCGVVIPPNDPMLFSEAIIKLKNSPKLLREMGINSKNLACSRFDRKDLSSTFVDFLEKSV
jgi:glycosyltransferase involved in cell wall biosynthesis